MELPQYPEPRLLRDRRTPKLDTMLCGMKLNEGWLFYLLQSHTMKLVQSGLVRCMTCVPWYLFSIESSRIYDRDESDPEGIGCSRVICSEQPMPFDSSNTINQSLSLVFHASMWGEVLIFSSTGEMDSLTVCVFPKMQIVGMIVSPCKTLCKSCVRVRGMDLI